MHSCGTCTGKGATGARVEAGGGYRGVMHENISSTNTDAASDHFSSASWQAEW